MRNFLQKFSFIFIILIIVVISHYSLINGISNSKLAVSFDPDTQYILSVIEWNQYSLLNEPSSIYHLNYFYPNGYVTFHGHPLFGETLIFILLNNLAGVSLVNTYNIYLLLSLWIGGIGVFLFAREILENTMGGLFAAGVYVFAPHLKQIAYILNIFSFFWVGFVLYFIVKFYKEKKWKYALMSGFFIFLQGLFSIYHGFFLIAIFLPLLFVFLLIFRYINLKALLQFAAAQIPFLILLVLIFHPFLTTIQDSGLKRAFHYDSLVDSSMLFKPHSSFYNVMNISDNSGVKYFPGFVSILLALTALFGISRKNIFWFTLFLIQFILMFYFSLKGFLIIPNILIILVIIEFALFVYFYKNIISAELKLWAMFSTAYFLIFFKFSSIFPGYEFSIYGLLLKLVPQFSNFRFLYRGILILFPVFSVIVAMGLIKIVRKKKKHAVLITLLFLLILGVENYAKYNLNDMKYLDSRKYSSIEKRSDKVILELPIYKPGVRQVYNSRYTINTQYHYNYYVNGRSAFRHFGSNSVIFNRIKRSKKFPTRKDLKYFLENFSVNYIIFNRSKKLLPPFKLILERVSALPDLCRIKEKNDRFIVLELFDTNPKKLFIRKYSPFHLKNRKLRLKLENNYNGRVSVSVPDRDVESSVIVMDSDEVIIEFPDISPSISGESVQIKFGKEIILKKIELIKK